MSLTRTQAVDEMVRLLRERWNALTPAVLGGSDPALLQWPGTIVAPPEVVQPFGRFQVRHAANPRHTFAPKGQRRFERSGLITIQCFGPIADPDWPDGGLSLAENLAIIARDAYEGEGTDDGLWFRNARIVEIGADKVYYQQQALVEFQYDETK
ncbi:tail terminator [Stenotrophomonas phage vB_SmaS_Bhz59]